MKKIFILIAVALMAFSSCADSKQSMTVTVTNPLALERAGHICPTDADIIASICKVYIIHSM